MCTIRLLIILLISWFPLGANAQLEGEWVSLLLHRLVFESDSVTIDLPNDRIYPNKYRYVIQDSIIEFQIIEHQQRIDSNGSSWHLDTSRYRYQISFIDSNQFRLVLVSPRNILAYQMDTLHFSRYEVQQRINISGDFSVEYSYSNPWARGRYDNFHILITRNRHCYLFGGKDVIVDGVNVYTITCQRARLSQAQYDKLKEELNLAQVYRWPYQTGIGIDATITEMYVSDSSSRIGYFYGCDAPYTAGPLYFYMRKLRRSLNFQPIDYVVPSNFENHTNGVDESIASPLNHYFWQMLRNNPFEE